jgi:hypothetical protein
MEPVRCVLCNSEMKIIRIDRFNKPHGIALMAAGLLFLAAIPAEAVLGFALIPFGAVVAFSKKEVWYCPSCLTVAGKLTSKTNPSDSR